jgi:hypothetical protein
MIVAGFAQPVSAFGIDISYCEEDIASIDPNGVELMKIAEAAAAIWEPYFIGNDIQEICMSWDAELSPDEDGNIILGNADSVFNNIVISDCPDPTRTDCGWYIDPTPLNHSEYNPVSIFYRDLFDNQKLAWFAGDPTDMLEVGYRNRTSIGDGLWDLLSTVIHEIGHILGINSDPFGGYWDLSPLQLGGATVRVRANLDDSGHLADEFALMCKGCGGPGIRRLPSAVDILAIDADEGPIEEVDLPRKHFLGGSWTNGPSWLGGRVPGSSDTAFVRNSSHLSLSTASVTVGNLFIDEGTEVYVHQDVTLSVLDTLALNSTEGFLQSEITVLNDGLLAIEDFQINGGKLDVSLGGVASIDGTLTVDNGGGFTGEIFGQGLVEIRSRLVNNGSIIADSTIFPLEFAYSGFSSKVLDLDGDNSPEDGVLVCSMPC